MQYKTCPKCKSNIDHGEKCDCDREKAHPKKTKQTNTHIGKVLTAPLTHENALIKRGYKHIAGVDEVGRGCVAGPVVACAVIMPPGLSIPGVNDSKLLNASTREKLADSIKRAAIAYRVEFVEAAVIDEVGIQAAICFAMGRALRHIDTGGGKPGIALIDGKPLDLSIVPDIEQKYIVRGDSQSHSIAAASILAKVERDAFMVDMHERYPDYGFNQHKGYGTMYHYNAIGENGLCDLHRRSFLKRLGAQA